MFNTWRKEVLMSLSFAVKRMSTIVNSQFYTCEVMMWKMRECWSFWSGKPGKIRGFHSAIFDDTLFMHDSWQSWSSNLKTCSQFGNSSPKIDQLQILNFLRGNDSMLQKECLISRRTSNSQKWRRRLVWCRVVRMFITLSFTSSLASL